MTPHSQYAWQGDRYVPRPTECYLHTNYKHPDLTMIPPPVTRPPPAGFGAGMGPRPLAHYETLPSPHPTEFAIQPQEEILNFVPCYGDTPIYANIMYLYLDIC